MAPKSTTENREPRTAAPTAQDSGEAGYVLLMVIFLSVLVVLSLAIAAPKVKQEIQRDRDIELRHRGMQYARAVKLYYKKFGTYPTTVAQLQTGSNLNTSSGFSSSGGTGFDSGSSGSAFGSGAAPNQQKFLRRLYADPITGKPQWRLVYFGQVGTGGANPNCAASGSTALSGSLSGSNSNNTPATDPTAAPTATDGSSSTADCTSSGGLGTPAANAGFSNSGSSSSFGGSSGSSFGGSSGSSFGGSSGSSFGGSSGGDSTFGGGFGSAGTGSNGTSGSSFGSTPNGQPAAGPIVGVASLSRKESIIEIKGKNHYNDLEFVYDPTQDFGGGAGLGGTSVGGSTTPSFGGTTQQPGGGLGSPIGSPTGNAPATPVTPTPDPGTGSGVSPQ